jgi:hypothetical protein
MKRIGVISLTTTVILVAALLVGCGAEANADAKSHVDAALGALGDCGDKITSARTLLEAFVADAPGLSAEEFAIRHAEVLAAVDDGLAAAGTAREEAEAAKAVDGVSNPAITTGADVVIRAAGSVTSVLDGTRTALVGTLGAADAFTGLRGKATVAAALAQTALMDQAATFASEAVDKVSDILN